MIATGESIPLLCLEGVPDLPSAPQDEAGVMRKFERYPCGWCRIWKTPISGSALEKNPMPGHLFEGNPVDEGTTGRSTDAPVHLRKTCRFHVQIDKWPDNP